MCRLFVLLICFLPTILCDTPEVPEIDLTQWWGSPDEVSTDSANPQITTFKVQFTNSMVADLRDRLTDHSKWVAPLEGQGFQYGFNTGILNSWLNTWAKDYNFTERQNYFNKYTHYRVNVQGLKIHFLRVSPVTTPGVQKVPLLMLHGWPGSFREFYEAIPMLTAVSKDRNFSVEVIVPSLPGFGFSSTAYGPGLGATEMAVVLRNLMHTLGYSKFYVQGGDWGSVIGGYMCTLFPKEVLGFHSNFAYTLMPWAKLFDVFGNTTSGTSVAVPVTSGTISLLDETGYFHEQATRPDTLGFGLTDSPAGLLAYIFEKFSSSINPDYFLRPDGGLDIDYKRVDLLDNLMVYWVNGCITSAMRIYAETGNLRTLRKKLDLIPTTTPMCALQAIYEAVFFEVETLRLKYPNIIRATPYNHGGHFFALTYPKDFSDDVLKAIGEFRDWHAKNDAST